MDSLFCIPETITALISQLNLKKKTKNKHHNKEKHIRSSLVAHPALSRQSMSRYCGLGSVPGVETDIPYQDASCCGQTKQIKKRPDSHNRRYLNSQ